MFVIHFVSQLYLSMGGGDGYGWLRNHGCHLCILYIITKLASIFLNGQYNLNIHAVSHWLLTTFAPWKVHHMVSGDIYMYPC